MSHSSALEEPCPAREEGVEHRRHRSPASFHAPGAPRVAGGGYKGQPMTWETWVGSVPSLLGPPLFYSVLLVSS